MAGANFLNTATKMAITSIVANYQGDNAADEVEHNLPSTALGMVSYGISFLASKLGGTNYKNQQFATAAGAILDILDAGIGIGFGKGLEKGISKALEHAAPGTLNALQKFYLANEKNIVAKYGQGAASFISSILGLDVQSKKQMMEYNEKQAANCYDCNYIFT